MFKTDKDYALEKAIELGRSYGFSVFDGHYYTGTVEALEAIGCVDIVTPTKE